MRKAFKIIVEDGKKYLLDYYSYTATFSALTAGASQNALVNIEADADFIVEKSTYFAAVAGAAQEDSSRVIPLVTLSIQDSGSGRNLQNVPTPIASIGGTGELPFMWPLPRTFRANSTINFAATNFSAATDYDVLTYTISGYKKFFLSNV